jgi:hypothetical protein
MKHTTKRSFILPLLTTFFSVYGIVSVYNDWLSIPLRSMWAYIDSMGVMFWACLLIAAVIVWVGDRAIRKRDG